MKRLLLLINLSVLSTVLFAQQPENWTNEQLIEPSVLANTITSKKDIPLILSVGPGAIIPNSVNIGMMNEAEGLKKLQSYLAGVPTGKKVVIYCGCCPFDHCPNVRPAIDALKEKGFTNYYLLNLPHNIKIDWIEKGYPTVK